MILKSKIKKSIEVALYRLNKKIKSKRRQKIFHLKNHLFPREQKIVIKEVHMQKR